MDSQLLISLSTMGGLGLILSIGLAAAHKKLRVEEDPRIKEIIAVLPGVNCGACGFASCNLYAESVFQGNADAGCCVVGGEDVRSKIAAIMNIQVEDKEKKVAVVCCQGGDRECMRRFRYFGILSCRAADMINGGDKACVYGCLGYEDCVRACPFNAIELNEKGLPAVREQACTGCGLCVEACPRNIISLIPASQKVYLGCVSRDRLKAVKEVCSAGCFTCTLCANPKVTPDGLIVMENNLPLIRVENIRDWEILGQAVNKCPAKCFVVR